MFVVEPVAIIEFIVPVFLIVVIEDSLLMIPPIVPPWLSISPIEAPLPPLLSLTM